MAATRHWSKFYDGGNFWSGSASYLSFFRHVAQLPIDWDKWDPYERLAKVGPRYSHRLFVLISDRPEFIHRDGQSRPHCADGPYIRWRDGTEQFYLHGVRVTARHLSGEMSAQEIAAESNAEVRRVLVGKYYGGNLGAYFDALGAKVLHEDVDTLGNRRQLRQIEQAGDEPLTIVAVTNTTPEPDGSHKVTTHRVDPALRPLPIPGIRADYGSPQALTCQNAVASGYGYYGFDWSPSEQT
jgi:hypothetical protein